MPGLYLKRARASAAWLNHDTRGHAMILLLDQSEEKCLGRSSGETCSHPNSRVRTMHRVKPQYVGKNKTEIKCPKKRLMGQKVPLNL